jgi:hypothetical protein
MTFVTPEQAVCFKNAFLSIDEDDGKDPDLATGMLKEWEPYITVCFTTMLPKLGESVVLRMKNESLVTLSMEGRIAAIPTYHENYHEVNKFLLVEYLKFLADEVEERPSK